MSSSTVAVQMNGLGSWLWLSRYSWIAAMNSGTEPKLPRRIACSVRRPNQHSTMLSQDDEVGTKWSWKRGCFSSQLFTLACP